MAKGKLNNDKAYYVNLCPQCGNFVPIGDNRYKEFICKRCGYHIQPEEKLIKTRGDKE